MTKQEVLKCLALIESIFSYCLCKSETVSYWLDVCDHLDYDNVMVNLKDHIRKCPYPPSFAELTATWDEKNQQMSKSYSTNRDWTEQYIPRPF